MEWPDPMKLYRVEPKLASCPDTERFLKAMNVHYVVCPSGDLAESMLPDIDVRQGPFRTIEFWPTEGPVHEVVYGGSTKISEFLKQGVFDISSLFEHDMNYGNKPMISLEVRAEAAHELVRHGLDKLLKGGEFIHIYLEPR
jgi:hypothetical protein